MNTSRLKREKKDDTIQSEKNDLFREYPKDFVNTVNILLAPVECRRREKKNGKK